MKKTFIVKVDYKELPKNEETNADVFHALGLEVAIDNLMEGYKETGSIQGDYIVKVRQI